MRSCLLLKNCYTVIKFSYFKVFELSSFTYAYFFEIIWVVIRLYKSDGLFLKIKIRESIERPSAIYIYTCTYIHMHMELLAR